MMANTLEDELQEAIQRYADKHWNGALEMDKITMSLADIASRYFAEIPLPGKRGRAIEIFQELTIRKICDRVAINNARENASS